MENRGEKFEWKATRNMRRQNRIKRREEMELPPYSLGEEIFASVTHGVSALFAIIALVFLLISCRKTGLVVTSVAVFGGTMILLYTISTIYHALGINKAKKVFRVLDHCTIFLLIAGTYTPVTLVCLGETKGLILFSVVWIAAIIGIVLNSISLKKFAAASVFCYVAMGWVIIFAMKEFTENASRLALICLFVGGVFYTLGAVLYGLGKKVRYMHSIFHLFVLAGSVFHTITIYEIVT